MITLATIEQETRDYAAVRRAALDQAAQIQSEIDAVREKHAKTLRRRVQRMTESHEALFERIAAAPALFPEGAKSIVVDGIKVGYQKGKVKLEIADESAAISALQMIIEVGPLSEREIAKAALKTTHKLSDAGLKKLSASQLDGMGVKLIPAVDSVLVMPQEDDATKAVDALIKAVQADIADGE